MSGIAAIVVTFNSEAEIGACLDSLRSCAAVIVVDNGSSDGTVAEVARRPAVRLIANQGNLGFAAAVNQGAQAACQPLLLILNPDTVVLDGLDALAAVCEKTGIAGGKLTGADGNVQAGFNIRRFPSPATLVFESLGWNRLWPGNPVNRRYRYADRDLNQSGPADQPAGAFLMVRRDVFDALGGFDESFYPVWFEDVDFARRACDAGYPAQYFSGAVVRHRGAHSVGKIPGECRTLYWYVSLLRYAAKHFGTMQFRLVCSAVAAGCGLRFVAGFFGDRGVWNAYRRVVRVAVASAVAGRLRTDRIRLEEWSRLEGGAGMRVASHPVER